MKEQKPTFEISVYDERFKDLAIRNHGTAKFSIYKDKKFIDQFEDVGVTVKGKVEVAEVEARARKFYDDLEIHPWLKKAYNEV